MDSKKCTKCRVIKSIDEFGYSKKTKDNKKHYCKCCARKLALDYSRTIKGLINSFYKRHTTNAKKRNIDPANYTKKDFGLWLLSQSTFIKIYNIWVESGYDRSKAPSIDRIDDYKGYSFDNIRLVTWRENKRKGHDDSKNGLNNKRNVSVYKCDINDNIIKEYYSIQSASRDNENITATKICACCKGKRKSTGGFKWKYKE